ncbi:hypothetical protein B0H63DRAFT_443166 [Podospora didyma]|uniref:Uncharacterized protein n=1 Tax=Podospora didyma TaxID=330526 RepID=A0AAE0P3Z0_9PEZI|nr:hypothetical protein B0H63DRAFT_443166 [Podospora didyma]
MSHSSFSTQSKAPQGSTEVRNFTIPADLFTTLILTTALEEIQKCPAALNNVKYLSLFVEANPTVDRPPDRVFALLVDVLKSMPHVEHLKWDTSPEQTEAYLPSVRRLTLAAFTDYLIPWCPNVENVAMSDQYGEASYDEAHGGDPFKPLISSSPRRSGFKPAALALIAPLLTGFLTAILAAAPNLTNLQLPGPFLPPNPSDWPTAPSAVRPHANFEDSLAILARFSNLENLGLPNVYLLGLDPHLNQDPTTGFTFSRAAKISRRVPPVLADKVDLATQVTAEALPHLKRIRIGTFVAPVTSVGGKAAVWPWTGRRPAWAVEEPWYFGGRSWEYHNRYEFEKYGPHDWDGHEMDGFSIPAIRITVQEP